MNYRIVSYKNNLHEFSTFEELIEFLYRNFDRYNSVNHFKLNGFGFYLHDVSHVNKFITAGSFSIYERPGIWIAYSPNNKMISPDLLKREIVIYDEKHRYNRSGKWGKHNHYFRDGPVPFTGVRHYGSYYRYPKTLQEKILNENTKSIEKEFDVKIKYKDRSKELPTSWSDIYIKKQNNWKKYRKTQWK